MILLAVLPCTISKSLSGRFLISEEVLERIFRHVLELHGESTKASSVGEREFIAKRVPTLEISYRDGTNYEIRDLQTLKSVVPGKGKRIDGITISSTSGDLTASVRFRNFDRLPSFEIRASGLEDRISYFIETIVSEVRRERDITVFARRVWPFFMSLLVCFLLFVSARWVFNPSAKMFWQILFLGFPISTMVLMIPIEMLRSRWLPPIGYLWGEDGKRADIAKSVVKACLVTLPLWVIGMALQLYLSK